MDVVRVKDLDPTGCQDRAAEGGWRRGGRRRADAACRDDERREQMEEWPLS
jgi:hypothetical protein